MAELVVPAALILIREHLVGLVDLLKFRLGVSVTGVEIGMILLRLLTVCFFYLVLSGIFADPEHLVKISFISQGKLLLFTYNVLLRDCKAIPQPVILFCKAALCTGASWRRPITAYYNTVSYCAARAASGRRVADPYKNLCVGSHNAAMCGFSASLIKAGNIGILCKTRRGVLPARERTLVHDRTGMVLTTQYRAKLRIAGCQFLRKVGNSGILCETRREVLRTRERTSVRDQVLRFSQRRIVRNYALPT